MVHLPVWFFLYSTLSSICDLIYNFIFARFLLFYSNIIWRTFFLEFRFQISMLPKKRAFRRQCDDGVGNELLRWFKENFFLESYVGKFLSSVPYIRLVVCCIMVWYLRYQHDHYLLFLGFSLYLFYFIILFQFVLLFHFIFFKFHVIIFLKIFLFNHSLFIHLAAWVIFSYRFIYLFI